VSESNDKLPTALVEASSQPVSAKEKGATWAHEVLEAHPGGEGLVEVFAAANRGEEGVREWFGDLLPEVAHILPTLSARIRDRLMKERYSKKWTEQAILRRQLVDLQHELEGPHPLPIERLMAERVVTCWLALHLAEDRVLTAEANETPLDFLTFLYGRLDLMEKRYQSAVMALARVRRLLVPHIGQLNIAQPGAQQLNVALTAPEATVLGELPGGHQSQD
jgi:hypothetical protein